MRKCLWTTCIARSWNCCNNWNWGWSEKNTRNWVHTLCDQPLKLPLDVYQRNIT